jgi:hypothetical protein
MWSHNKHHKYNEPIGMAALYCHWFDFYLNISPVLFSIIITQTHIYTAILYTILSVGQTIFIAHSNRKDISEFHSTHHIKYFCNFGVGGYCDKLFGTLSNDTPWMKTHQIISIVIPIGIFLKLTTLSIVFDSIICTGIGIFIITVFSKYIVVNNEKEIELQRNYDNNELIGNIWIPTVSQFIMTLIYIPIAVHLYNYIIPYKLVRIFLYPFNVWLAELSISTYAKKFLFKWQMWRYNDKGALFNGKISLGFWQYWIILGCIAEIILLPIL